VDDREVWRKVHPDIPQGLAPSETPLIVGKDRAYFAAQTPSDGYDLVAYKLQDGEELYRAPLIARRLFDDFGYPDPMTPVLALIRLGQGEEHIIQFDSTRLMTRRIGGSRSFSVINGADGQVVQTISASHGDLRFVKSTPTTFTLVAYPTATMVTLETFSRQSNGLFSRTWTRVVSYFPSINWGNDKSIHVTINPHTMQAFSVRGTANALTLIPTRRPDYYGPGTADLPIDEYFRTDEGKPVTLTPHTRPGRRAFNLTGDGRFACLISLDERRLVLSTTFWHRGREDTVYVIDFTARG
jgi:hypothetical protein